MAFKYETHMHTSEVSGCASATAAEQVNIYKERGYTGVIVTDHFVNGYNKCPRELSWDKKMHFMHRSYAAAKEAGDKCGLDVFFGWEFNISGKDFLTYGLDLDFLLKNPGLDELPIKEYTEVIRENGGFLAQAHPFRVADYIRDPGPAPPEFMDAVEVHNASMTPAVNAEAREFAIKHGLPMLSSSDAHHLKLSFSPSGVILKKRAENVHDIINAIKNGEIEMIL